MGQYSSTHANHGTHQTNSDLHNARRKAPAAASSKCRMQGWDFGVALRSPGTWNECPVMSAWILQLAVGQHEHHMAEEGLDLAAVQRWHGCYDETGQSLSLRVARPH